MVRGASSSLASSRGVSFQLADDPFSANDPFSLQQPQRKLEAYATFLNADSQTPDY
jgi:hypothetical protein